MFIPCYSRFGRLPQPPRLYQPQEDAYGERDDAGEEVAQALPPKQVEDEKGTARLQGLFHTLEHGREWQMVQGGD
jgi:hypothetical protein